MTIRKLTIIAPFLLGAFAFTAPAGAQEITCEMVRQYVAQVGYEQASSIAREHGITPSQERMARACLAQNLDRPHKQIRVTSVSNKRSSSTSERRSSSNSMPAGAIF
jgi:hypothetical protein